MKRIYLDYTATTPVDRRVIDAMTPYLGGTFGNASSIHSYGREAKAALEGSRDRLAGLLGVKSSELFFTSGGTESDNVSLMGLASTKAAEKRKHIVISAIEHHAVFHTAESLRKNGFSVTILPVEDSGLVSTDNLKLAMTDETLLVSVIHVNNEIGTIQNLAELSQAAHEHGAIFHTDAVQSFGKIPFSPVDAGVDAASFTAHKIYGPKGIGAIYVRRGIELDPIMHGGSQERNRRPGTESVFLAVGFARAAEIASEELAAERERFTALNSLMRERILAELPGCILNSPPASAIPNILSVSVDSRSMEIDGEALLINMDLEGIAVASGSACSSGSLQPSHVIKALGRDDATTMATVRFSFGRFTSEEDVIFAVDRFINIVRRIGKRKKISSHAA